MSKTAEKKTESKMPYPLYIRGKVRDVYDMGDRLLMVASDRISAFDYVLPTPVPDKGKILNKMSAFWFSVTQGVVPNHLIAVDVKDFPADLKPFLEELVGRSMIVRKTDKFPIECVVRGYLAGSGWKEYQKSCTICGIPIPEGIRESGKLPVPVFTPATKEEGGKHDENISFNRMVDVVGLEDAHKLRELSLKLYTKAAGYLDEQGLILCDTKFEFGKVDGKIILIDEALTPDSSRFWDKSTWKEGVAQDSFDKQYVRDYLEKLGWNKQPPVPELPAEVVQKTREKYLDAYKRVVGHDFRD